MEFTDLSFPFNYEKLQTLGFTNAIRPILEKIYKNADKETKVKAFKRHLEFYNSQQNTGALILGVTAAMEEKTSEDEKDAVVAMKTGLMGPLAGLGDSLLKFTWMPICGSIGAAFAFQGNVIGPILMFILFNIVNVLTKYYGIHWGYSKGVGLLERAGSTNLIQRISTMANVVGVVVVGAMICTTMKVKTPLQIVVGENEILIQDLLDTVMPNLLILLTTLGFYFFFKKTNGKHTVPVIFGIMIISVILTYLGILA